MPIIYEFAIKKDVLNSGKEILTPVCRRKPKYKWLGDTPWLRITEIYGVFTLLELTWNPEMTFEECDRHIKGYQSTLLKGVENNIALVEFQNLENKEI